MTTQKKLTIAIDFDDTFTVDPAMWAEFCNGAKSRGHHVYMVSARRKTIENTEIVDGILEEHKCYIPIIFTDLGSKIHAMESRDVKVDIWIDDDPEKLVRGH